MPVRASRLYNSRIYVIVRWREKSPLHRVISVSSEMLHNTEEHLDFQSSWKNKRTQNLMILKNKLLMITSNITIERKIAEVLYVVSWKCAKTVLKLRERNAGESLVSRYSRFRGIGSPRDRSRCSRRSWNYVCAVRVSRDERKMFALPNDRPHLVRARRWQ